MLLSYSESAFVSVLRVWRAAGRVGAAFTQEERVLEVSQDMVLMSVHADQAPGESPGGREGSWQGGRRVLLPEAPGSHGHLHGAGQRLRPGENSALAAWM
jgi:hypothetical protein